MGELLLEVVSGLFSALMLHELGHATAAWLGGARQIRVYRLGWRGAAVEATFPTPHRGRRALFFVAGPITNLIAAGGALALTLQVAAGIHVAMAVFALMPLPGNDGARLLSLVSRRE